MIDYNDNQLVKLTVDQAEDLVESKEAYPSIEALILALQTGEHSGALQWVPMGTVLKALFWGYEVVLGTHSVDITTSVRELLLNKYLEMKLVNGEPDRDGRAGFKHALNVIGIQVGGINTKVEYPVDRPSGGT